MILHVRWTDDSDNDGYYPFSDQYDKASVDRVNEILSDFAEDNPGSSWEWVQYREDMPKGTDFNQDLVFSWFGVNVFHSGYEPAQDPSPAPSEPMLLEVTWVNELFGNRVGKYSLHTYGPWKHVQQTLRDVFNDMKADNAIAAWKWTGMSESESEPEPTGNFHSDLVHAYFGLDLVIPGTYAPPISNSSQLDVSKILSNFEASCDRMQSLGIDDGLSGLDADMIQMFKALGVGANASSSGAPAPAPPDQKGSA